MWRPKKCSNLKKALQLHRSLFTIELSSRKRANMLIDQSKTKLIDLNQNQLRAHAHEMKISLAFSIRCSTSQLWRKEKFFFGDQHVIPVVCILKMEIKFRIVSFCVRAFFAEFLVLSLHYHRKKKMRHAAIKHACAVNSETKNIYRNKEHTFIYEQNIFHWWRCHQIESRDGY